MSLIFLPIEVTARELDYKINLARLFCNEGMDVILGNPPFIRGELKHRNYKAIFLEKGLNPDPEYYSLLSKKGIYLYDLGDEGAAEPVYSINYQPAVDSLKLMRKIFLWGTAQKDDLIKRNSDPILTEKYRVLGNPGFDLCMVKYKEFHKGLKPKMLPQSYILINTNFGCFQSYNFQEQLKACDSISPLSKQMVYDGYLKEEKQFAVFKEWLENIIESFPEEHFVLRPHPSEIQKNYEVIFKKYKNVLVSKAGNANQIIASAKLILHKDCSTAMQSYLMEVPAISLGGEALYHDYVQWPLAFSALPENLEKAKKIIADVLITGQFNSELHGEIDKNAKNRLNDHFYNIGNSSRDLVNWIIKDAEKLIKDQSPHEIIDLRSPLQKLKQFIRKQLPLYYKVPLASRETMVKFTKKDILKRLCLLEFVDPLGIDLKVKKIFPNAFQISRK